MQRPEAALAGLVRRARYLDETIIERQRVPDGVLPPLLVLSIVGKLGHDKLINVVERQTLRVALVDGHVNEADV